MNRYGKPCREYLKYTAAYFDIAENESATTHTDRVRELYLRQPLRQHCKMCNEPISGTSFTSSNIGHFVCIACGHVNGAHDDTAEFCRQLYVGDDSGHLARHYASADKEAYFDRVRDIYAEKAKFLFQTIRDSGNRPEDLSYADLGAGSGYFVAALLDQGATKVSGYEVSVPQIDFGNKMLEGSHLCHHDPDELVELASKVEADVVTMVFVLEHVRQHGEVLNALRRNRHVRYLFIGVPVFGLSNFLEPAFPAVFARHTGGHTHFYTRESIAWMCQAYNFESIGEWWFGADIVDLVRSVSICLKQRKDCEGAAEVWEEMLMPLIDNLQLEVDRAHLASEVHLVLKCAE